MKAYCDKCCLVCDKDKKICEVRKERGRIIRREIYWAKKLKKLQEQR